MFQGVGIGMCNEMNGSDSSEGQIWLQLVRNKDTPYILKYAGGLGFWPEDEKVVNRFLQTIACLKEKPNA